MKYFYLAVFVDALIVHLFGCIKNVEIHRDMSKGFIMFSILGFYLESADERRWFIILALFFGFIGDFLMIPSDLKVFPVGGASFLACNVFLILEYCTRFEWQKTNPIFVILPMLLFLAVTVFVYFNIRKSLPKLLLFGTLGYLMVNGFMNTVAICKMIDFCDLGAILTVVGALLFFSSDTALFMHRFKKKSIQKSQFFVMITYSIGQFLIVLGLIL